MISSCLFGADTRLDRRSEQGTGMMREAVVYDPGRPLVIEMPLERIDEAST